MESDERCCACNQLEAEALHSNEQLLAFDVRSKDIAWHDHIEPLQERAAPVYLQRQFELMSNYREPIGNHNRREVLLCHDMMGNYLEDRHYNCSKKYDDYRFYHWAAIDYFCYFSHKYCTIPPCGWINAAHRHGVRVLGTFITEGSNGSRLLHEVLQSNETVDRVVEAMVKLCKHYQFEGWLVNVECTVNASAMDTLHYFVDRLRGAVTEEIPYGCVFWYDSVIATGQLQWQNELNAKNVSLFRRAHGMLINYTWTDGSLLATRDLCEQESRPGEHEQQRREQERAECQQRVFFGLDVFGRGQTAKFRSKQTLARIAKHRFSAGIFAPGWTYETLQQLGYDIKQPLGDSTVNEAFLLRNEKFWWTLWEHLATHPYDRLPFYTDFCLGSGLQTFRNGRPVPPPAIASTDAVPLASEGGRFFNLSRQSLQPSVPLHMHAERCYEDAYNGGSCLRICHYDSGFRLFATDFQLRHGGLVCAYAYKLQPRDGELDCILRLCTGNNARDCYLFLGDYHDSVSLQKGRCYVSPLKAKYHGLLADNGLDCQRIPRLTGNEDATTAQASDGWRVRYYVVAFDGHVQVKDIGVLYRRAEGAVDTAYLGAIYVNEFDEKTLDLPADGNVALIQIYGGDLLN